MLNIEIHRTGKHHGVLTPKERSASENLPEIISYESLFDQISLFSKEIVCK